MKAVYLEEFGKPLVVRDMPEPALRAGGVIVQMESVPLLSYMRQVINGELGYQLPVPCIPGTGGIGKVLGVADDVFDFKPGQLVYLDPMVGSHANGGGYDAVLIGLTGLSPLSGRTFSLWRHGTFAERALVPAETLTVLDTSIGVEQLTALTRLTISYGGLLKTGLRAGQTVMIGGATGNIGAGGVLVALAMGAAKVIALGRDTQALSELQAIDPARVVPVTLKGDSVEKDTASIQAAAADIDAYFDMTGRAPDPEPIMAALGALRHGGTAVFMGGVKATLPLSYSQIMRNELTIRGNFMYPRTAPAELFQMVRAGTLDLARFSIQSFPLADIDKAIDQAGRSKGLNLTVLRPQL